MNLPHADRVVIDERKIREYLLSRSHTIGRFKAAFFARAGFRVENWRDFASALRDLALRGEAVSTGTSEFGEKYLVSGTIMGPRGLKLEVTSVWLIPSGGVPRLVTVYPR